MDNGVPQTAKRNGARVAGGDGAKSGAKGAAPKPGPVDPRTEDPSSPIGISRSAKTVYRRPGALIPRTAKRRENANAHAPIDFSLSLPLTAVPAEPVPETADSALAAGPMLLRPTVPTPTTLSPPAVDRARDELVPTGLLPTGLVPPAPAPAPITEVLAPILYDQAATIDDVTQIGPVLDTRPLRKPIRFRRQPKPRVRRVTRILRHVDTWSVFKVALVFNVFFYAVAMVAGVLLWQVAYATGTIDNVEKFFEGFGWETFNFNGGQIFHNAWIAGLFVAVGLTGLAVLMATLFNLITDLVGGIRLSVLEEEVRTRVERGTERAPEPAPPPVVAHDVDDDLERDAEAFGLFGPPADEAIAG